MMHKTKMSAISFLIIIGLAMSALLTIPMFTPPVKAADSGWTLVTDSRPLKGYANLTESIWQKNAAMTPNGSYDKIGLHRLVKTSIMTKGAVFILAGIYGSGEQLISNPPQSNYSFDESSNTPVYWANRGFDVYSIDYRAHFLPSTMNASQASSIVANWGWDVYISDLKEAVDKAKTISGYSKIFMAGMSFGESVAMYYASEYWKQDLKGIILLDGSENTIKFSPTTNISNVTAGLNANAGGLALEYPRTPGPSPYPSGILFAYQMAIQNPGAPAEWPPGTPLQPTINPLTNQKWTNITEWFAYQWYSSHYSNIYGGYGNLIVNIQRSAGADRYFPFRLLIETGAIHDWNNCPFVTYDFDDHYNQINVPVLGFRSGWYGIPTWGNYTNGLATSDFTQITLPNYGHLDMFTGTYSARDVSEPALEWMVNHTSVFSSGFEDGFNSWTTTYGGVSTVSSLVYQGSYAMKCSDPWGSLAAKSIGSQSETCTSAEFCFDKNLAGDETLIGYRYWNGSPIASMGISVQSGRVFVFVQDLLPSYSYSQYELTGFFTLGTWYKFALDVSATSATIYVNDHPVTSLSQMNIPAVDSVNVGMFWGNGAYTGNLFVDNVQIDTRT